MEITKEEKKTTIKITIRKSKVSCEIAGDRNSMVEALATLMTDETEDKNNFRHLIEEAMQLIMLEKMHEYNQEQRIKEYMENEKKLPN